MEAVLTSPTFVLESRTTFLEIKIVSTLGGPLSSISVQEKPGMINPAITSYLLFARYLNENNNDKNDDFFPNISFHTELFSKICNFDRKGGSFFLQSNQPDLL